MKMKPLSIFKKAIFGASIVSTVTMAAEIPSHVIKAYQAGLAGSQAQNQHAINALKELNEKAPSPITLAMLGSAETTQARYTNQPWQKMKFAELGISKLNKAVKQVKKAPYPQQARVYITAGCTFSQVPKMMNRAEHGDHLLKQVIAERSEFDKLNNQLKKMTYRCAAMAADKLEDQPRAKSLLEKSETFAQLLKSEKE